MQGNSHNRFIFTPLPTLLADESKTGRIPLSQVTYPLTQLCPGELKMGRM